MIAAIFDIDGTLLKGPSTDRLFLRYLLKKGLIRPSHVLRSLAFSLVNLPKGKDIMIKKNKDYLRGLSRSELYKHTKPFFAEYIRPRIAQSARDLVKEHQFQGHYTILISAALQCLVDLWKYELETDEGIGTVIGVQGDTLTGKIEGVWPYGEGKSHWLEYIVEKYNLDLRKCYGYGDHYSDRFFLERLGHPVVVGPKSDMKIYAKKRGWLITDSV